MHLWVSQRCIVGSTDVNEQKVHEVVYLTGVSLHGDLTRLYNQALYNQAGVVVNLSGRGVHRGMVLIIDPLSTVTREMGLFPRIPEMEV